MAGSAPPALQPLARLATAACRLGSAGCGGLHATAPHLPLGLGPSAPSLLLGDLRLSHAPSLPTRLGALWRQFSSIRSLHPQPGRLPASGVSSSTASASSSSYSSFSVAASTAAAPAGGWAAAAAAGPLWRSGAVRRLTAPAAPAPPWVDPPIPPPPSAFQRFVSGTVGLFRGIMYSSLLLYFLYRSYEEVPVSGRMHAAAFVPSPLLAIKREVNTYEFHKLRQEAAKQGRVLPPTHPYVQRVQRLGDRIAVAAASLPVGPSGEPPAHMRGLHWEYLVLKDGAASGIPTAATRFDGKVIVSAEYIKQLDLLYGPRTADEVLAHTIAHEAGHMVAKHEWDIAASKLFRSDEETARMQRRLEYEADAIGLAIATRACFNPSRAIAYLEFCAWMDSWMPKKKRYGQIDADPFEPVYGTHPPNAKRVARLRSLMDSSYRTSHRLGCEIRESAFERCGRWLSAEAARMRRKKAAPPAFDDTD
ncbi:hypothetical protein HYH03_002113 [Edaphochlamys debaryana]|uniref:Peptidase M48 domain-containing protein n=1 Tax=Edaphochlamys debaryana TaxID=47281 RepID=A0A835YF96_9CHLO|nr:hypothetical protein HYH03_002113 [Edaphochlamys debaryana]|eukprot:KAG2499821.1 hypothetical protein HYH03_002113 [Edaphochlamys debaryana]